MARPHPRRSSGTGPRSCGGRFRSTSPGRSSSPPSREKWGRNSASAGSPYSATYSWTSRPSVTSRRCSGSGYRSRRPVSSRRAARVAGGSRSSRAAARRTGRAPAASAPARPVPDAPVAYAPTTTVSGTQPRRALPAQSRAGGRAVASGLESVVVGEDQILGQVKLGL
ncbi:hypothetical protein ACWCPG_28875, partial [Streptomyces sp. NPDC001919]